MGGGGNGRVSLISEGPAPPASFDSALLSASANGSDAYFFTRDTLVRRIRTASCVKIYDAREEGGFPSSPPPVPCKASDECHGAGSQNPPPPRKRSPRTPVPAGTSARPKAAKREAKCKRGTVHRHKRTAVRRAAIGSQKRGQDG